MKKTMPLPSDTQSNWGPALALMEGTDAITLGRYAAYWVHKTPRRLLHSISYYKFAAKMIGPRKRVLDVGCNEGIGSWVIAKECGFCQGLDFDEEAVKTARANFDDPSIAFSCEDFLTTHQSGWDGFVCFDVIEHILPSHAGLFIQKVANSLKDNGVAIIGTPSQISQDFASEVSKKGHINIYSHERLEAELKEQFEFVFLFSAHDEVVHTGYLPLAHYFIAVCCKKKKPR